MDVAHSIAIIVVVALVTMATRFTPFLILSGGKETPSTVTYLGKVLPFALIGMLVIYCLKDVSLTAAPFGLPELIAGSVVVLLHLWRRNTLLSVGVGTVSYMLLVQFVFV